MYNILYYGLGATIISSCSMGILYAIDPQLANNITNNISWNMVKMYHYFKYKYDKNKKLYKKITNSKNENENNNFNLIFIGYTCNNNNSYTTINLSDQYLKDNSFDIMFLMYKNKYKRMISKDDVFKLIEMDNTKLDDYFDINNKTKILLQVQIEQYNQKIDIHEFLNQFYMNDNKILDTTFLEWYLYEFYAIQVDKGYKLNIIDGDINIFNISSVEYLIINKNDDSYNYNIRIDST